jgi:hypothetical protein
VHTPSALGGDRRALGNLGGFGGGHDSADSLRLSRPTLEAPQGAEGGFSAIRARLGAGRRPRSGSKERRPWVAAAVGTRNLSARRIPPAKSTIVKPPSEAHCLTRRHKQLAFPSEKTGEVISGWRRRIE